MASSKGYIVIEEIELSSNSENNKRIVKNTLALYFRQIITIFLSLFTSRIVLQTLGVTDYGIYSVVGNVVVMLSFLTSSLAGTTQRFLSIELGKNDFLRQKQVFSNSLSLHIIFIFLAVILAETLGLWLVRNKLVIPDERTHAAFWVYQFSVVSFTIAVLFAPFDGAVRAHERFDFFAKTSIFEVVMRLTIVYLLTVLPYDKLIAFSLLGMCVGIVSKVIVYIYCRVNFEECRLKILFVKSCIKQLLGYNTFAIIGGLSAVIRFHGLNIILNLYYGPVMNAAQGIANTVFTAISSFSDNAALATQPQIVMSYAKNNKERLWSLITKSSRLYFYLLLILAFPFILEMNTALYIWLGAYPEYAVIFAQLFLLEALQRVFGHPLGFANSAVGKLREVTIIGLFCRLLILFVAVLVGKNKLSPVYIYFSALVLQGINLFVMVIIVLKLQLGFSVRKYFGDVMLPIIKTCLFAVPVPVFVHYFLSRSTVSSVGVGIFTLIYTAIIVFYIGLNLYEKQMIISRLPSFMRKMVFFK